MKSRLDFLMYGVRGSFPAASGGYPAFCAYNPNLIASKTFEAQEGGGDTTTLVLIYRYGEGQVRFIMIDQGTATKRASRDIALMAKHLNLGKFQVDIWMTHGHDDHGMGCAGNELILNPKAHLRYFSPELSRWRKHHGRWRPDVPMAEQILGDYLAYGYWPDSVVDMYHSAASRREHVIYEPGGQDLVLDGYTVKTIPLVHNGGCAGLRYVLPGLGDIAICTDHEPTLDDDVQRVGGFIDGAKIAYLDEQYRLEEYLGRVGIGDGPAMSREGWGHGTPEHLAAMLGGLKHGIDRVYLGHHDQDRTSRDMAEMEEETRDLWKGCGVKVKHVSMARPSRAMPFLQTDDWE